jgi:hypothetical protein
MAVQPCLSFPGFSIPAAVLPQKKFCEVTMSAKKKKKIAEYPSLAEALLHQLSYH